LLTFIKRFFSAIKSFSANDFNRGCEGGSLPPLKKIRVTSSPLLQTGHWRVFMVCGLFYNGWFCRISTVKVKFFVNPFEHFPPATGRFGSIKNIMHAAVSFS